MWKNIVNPKTGKKVNLKSKLGKRVLHNYIIHSKLIGGANMTGDGVNMTGGGAKFDMRSKTWFSNQHNTPGIYSQLEADVFNILGIKVTDQRMIRDGLFKYKNSLLDEVGFNRGINKSIEEALEEKSIDEINIILDKITKIIELRKKDASEQYRRRRKIIELRKKDASEQYRRCRKTERNKHIYIIHLIFIERMEALYNRVLIKKNSLSAPVTAAAGAAPTKKDLRMIVQKQMDLNRDLKSDFNIHSIIENSKQYWNENGDASWDEDEDIWCSGCEGKGLPPDQCVKGDDCLYSDSDIWCSGCEALGLPPDQCVKGVDCLYGKEVLKE